MYVAYNETDKMKCHAFQKIVVQNLSMLNVMTNSYGKHQVYQNGNDNIISIETLRRIPIV
jgi:hypothetical protein